MFSPLIGQMYLRNKVNIGGRCSGLVENMENFTFISWLLPLQNFAPFGIPKCKGYTTTGSNLNFVRL